MAFDPDLGRKGFGRDIFRLRFRELRLSQSAFAARFGLSFAMIRDQEQCRAKPAKAFKVLLAAIELDPHLVARAAVLAAEKWPDDVHTAAP